jgi:hypothetical protein
MTRATGHCLCEHVHYDFAIQDAISAHHCHCRDCRRVTGSGKATVVMLPKDALTLTGELKAYHSRGSDGHHVTREFCPHCGSPILSHVQEIPGMVFIKPGGLVDGSWLTIQSSFWSSTAEPWDPVREDIPCSLKNPLPGEL